MVHFILVTGYQRFGGTHCHQLQGTSNHTAVFRVTTLQSGSKVSEEYIATIFRIQAVFRAEILTRYLPKTKHVYNPTIAM
jgi:hypothetical protein